MLNRLRRERGQELLEYALVLPVLLALILGIMQLALVILSYNTIGDAARQGARFGVTSDNADYPDRIKAVVYQVTDAAGMNRADLSFVTPMKQSDNQRIRVDVTYNMRLIVPIFIAPIASSGRIPLRAVSTKLLEVR
jgi:Flp pilus assembly protein TadG